MKSTLTQKRSVVKAANTSLPFNSDETSFQPEPEPEPNIVLYERALVPGTVSWQAASLAYCWTGLFSGHFASTAAGSIQSRGSFEASPRTVEHMSSMWNMEQRRNIKIFSDYMYSNSTGRTDTLIPLVLVTRDTFTTLALCQTLTSVAEPSGT